MMQGKLAGFTKYQGLLAHQAPHYLPVWTAFLTDVRPARIVEIGTAEGGFILSLKHAMDGINPQCVVRSYDMNARGPYAELRTKGVDVHLENLFNYNYDDLLPEKRDGITAFIQEPGTTVVICDGGSKTNEFRLLAPLMKDGDFILAHDYAESQAHFYAEISGRIWNWCEITEDDIREVSLAENLVRVWNKQFEAIAWVCKQKVARS
jgi:cephalosporin hydroxylase